MVFSSKTERECNGSYSALFVSMKGGNGMKSRSHIFALITACVFLFCGCSDYLSLSKASTISNPQTEYDTALKEYLASLETPLSTIEIKHGEDTPIVWEDTGMEAAVRLLLNRPEGTISRSDVWNLNTLTITERTMFEGDSGTTTIVTVTAQQGDATLEQEISAVGKESPLPALVSLHDLQYFDSLQTFSYSTSPTANQAFTDFSGVEELSHLERFSMNGARPETLEPLSHLSQLKQLSLTECGTLDLTPLEGLDQLESLILSSNDRIVSLEPVTKLPALRSLSLSSGTAVPSLEPLAQTNLAVLDLGLGVGQSGLYKEIDYSPLSQLPDLVCLNLTNHTRVTTKFCKQILAHSPDLRFLNIQNTPASEGSALDVEYLWAYTEADLLKRLANKLRNTLG